MGISESTQSDLDSLLHEVKKEQGTSELPSSSGASNVFSHIVAGASTSSHKCLSRDSTLDTLLQQELKETREKSDSSYRKLQVCVNV